MNKILAFCFTALVPVIILNGCAKKIPSQSDGQTPESDPPAQSESADSSLDLSTPEGAAEILFKDINTLDDEKIEALNREYFAGQAIPEEYYSILKPIFKRVSYKIVSCEIDGGNAVVGISVTSVDAKSALNSVVPGALAHLAVMQVAGKDVSNPEKILADYAAKNIEWDELPTIKTNTSLYLKRNANGEWKADLENPGNVDFANAITGGALDIAQNIKHLADKYK